MLTHQHEQSLTPSRVVVLGAQGFVGAALMTRLAAAGVASLGLGRSDVDLLSHNAAQALAAHLRSDDALVAVAAVAPCKDANMLVQNMQIARTIAQALTIRPVAHLINISSDAVYGDSDQPLSESSPAAPESLHGVMHLARELVLREVLQVPLAILRPTLLYGALDPHNGYGPNRFARLALRGEAIRLFGEGEELRDHVFVADVAELALRVLLRRSRGVLNVATGEVRSFRSIAEDLVRWSNSLSSISGSPRVGPMPHRGYRAFDRSACSRAFPDFRYTGFNEGAATLIRPGQPAGALPLRSNDT
jgi:nucleoside-diphosphate-sugar epimerase